MTDTVSGFVLWRSIDNLVEQTIHFLISRDLDHVVTSTGSGELIRELILFLASPAKGAVRVDAFCR
jgi:hypothetical protein